LKRIVKESERNYARVGKRWEIVVACLTRPPPIAETRKNKRYKNNNKRYEPRYKNNCGMNGTI
jgi:hypothetical protein